jgi:multidrug resistance efflux pump
VRVNVQVGDHVTPGQVVAQLDTKLLDLGVQQAKNSATRARINVRVLKNSLDTIADNQDKLATGKEQLATGKQQLATGKATLRNAKAQLLSAQAKLLEAKRSRPQIQAGLAALKQQAASFPPGHVPPALLKKIAQLQGLLASINPGLKQVNAGLAKLAAAEAQLATAQTQLATAAGQLATAGDALKTAKKQVIRARDSLEIIADASHLVVTLAQVKRDQATIVSPVAGVVTQAAAQGTVAMVGSPIVRVDPDEPALVDTYLTGAQLGAVHAGTVADITYDSSGGRSAQGTLSLVDDQALFPPTSFPTDIVHMTRTVKVTFRLDSGQAPPPGTPVDIAIHTD